MKKNQFILRAVVLFVIIIVSCKESPKNNNYGHVDSDTTVSLNDTAIVTNSADVVKKSNWTYSEKKDPMTEKVRYFAVCESNNTINFDFPYEGGTRLQVMIRKMNGRNEVILAVDKGQFSSPYNSNVKIKFDDENVRSYGFNDAADGSSNYIFLQSSPSIIKKIKTAKKLKAQPQFYQEGQTVFEFDIEGLKWEY